MRPFVLAQRPAIAAIDAFLSPAERDALEDRGGDWAAIGRARPTHDETGFSWEMPIPGDPLLAAVCARVDAAVGVPDAFHDSLRFRRYGPGEHLPPRLDHDHADGHSLVLTALLVIDAPRLGGETHFPHAEGGPLFLPAVPGRLLWWWNVLPDGRPDPASVHAATPVVRGQKVTLTRFVYHPDSAPLPAALP
jgi:hypothetical protein